MCVRLTTDEFILRAKVVHGKRFDYTLTNYTGSKTKVCIICRIHGNFLQKPLSHIYGYGCSKCAADNRKKSTEQFLKSANKVHDNFYNYNLVKYINIHTKISIICPIHGEFLQTPTNHLSGHGCHECAILLKSKTLRKTANQFISDAQKIHRDNYDYSSVNYVGGGKKICIICKNHGEFWQVAKTHLGGSDCPKCRGNISKKEILWLDEMNIPEKFRQHRIKLDNKIIKVDGYDPITNTVYEFLGDFWHGNLSLYDKTDVNRRSKKTFGELRKNTFARFRKLRKLGYTVVYIWENDYNKKHK